ncbi:MAG: VOC family protein [Nanoarchaeota archaeon]|nr:VOC family protein [Nanoarchaeota archaeon]
MFINLSLYFAVSSKADYICYKCDSQQSFEALRAIFEQNSDYMYQSIISKRRISYVKLKQGIETLLGKIYFLELSDQKPDRSQKNGFDHIEVYGATISYDALVAKLAESEKVIKVERPHHTTHDIEIKDGFLFRCTKELLVEKIKREEMV